MTLGPFAKGDREAPGLPSGFFALRTPLLSVAEYMAWGDGLACTAGNAVECGAPTCDGRDSELDRRLARDLEILRARISRMLDRAEITEALYLASPDLLRSAAAWRANPTSHRARRFELAVVRYFSRLCNRPTPFGLFAGSTTGQIAERTVLQLHGRESYARRSRVDTGFLAAFIDALVSQRAYRAHLQFKTNGSSFCTAGRMHYVESGGEKAMGRQHQTNAVHTTPYLERVLVRAREGASIQELAGALVDDSISVEEASDFVHELIDSEILVPTLQVAVTGVEPAAQLVAALADETATRGHADSIRSVVRQLEQLDAKGVGLDIQEYGSVVDALRELPGVDDVKHLVQVDMKKPAHVLTLAREDVRELAEAGTMLHRLVGKADTSLHSLRDKFLARYDRQEISLVEALDEEVGIGHRSDARGDSTANNNLEWTNYLGGRVMEVVECGANELNLNPKDVEPFLSAAPAARPVAYAVVASVACSSKHGMYDYHLLGVSGPSGISMLGRFLYADPELHSKVSHHVLLEEATHPDAVFAEVAHLPHGRMGNIICRPALRKYEIAYLCASGVPVSQQIPVTDLLLSVTGGRFVLRSKRLHREVIPRLSSAHNYMAPFNSPLYRFLGMLQRQDVAPAVQWRWGALASLPYLPRVRVGRCVLALATWTVRRNEVQITLRSDRERFAAVQRLRRERRLPRYVAIVDSQQGAYMVVDLDNTLEVMNLWSVLRRREMVTLNELWPTLGDQAVEGPEGRFANEVVIPFVQRRASTAITESRPAVVATPDEHVARHRRTYPPGSEWMYVKFYCGPAGADGVLLDTLVPVLRAVANDVDGWYFVRYRDPEPHLRVRVHAAPEILRDVVDPLLQQAIDGEIVRERVWRVQRDTYEREIERYGGVAATELAEQFFHADSDAVAKILAALRDCERLDLREHVTALSIDALMSDFGLGRDNKCRLLGALPPPTLLEKRIWSAQFRQERAQFAQIIEGSVSESLLGNVFAALDFRSARNRSLVDGLRAQQKKGRLRQPTESILLSYAHMTVNRMLRLRSENAVERKLYDRLRLYHSSELARHAATQSGRAR